MVARLKPNIRRLAEIEHTRKICVHSPPEKGEIQMSHGPDNPYKEQCGCPDCLLEEASITNSAREFYQSLLHMGYENAIAVLESRDRDLWTKAQEQMREKVKQSLIQLANLPGIRRLAETVTTQNVIDAIGALPLDPLPAGEGQEVKK
jgi:hypothetical protein